jgi:alpha-beta hydrolase superfamily lysophospholipase
MLQNMINRNIISESETLREQLTILPLESVNPASYPDTVNAYFTHYGLAVSSESNIEHYFGSFHSGEITLAAHLYTPPTYTATVILLHGYLNHSGQFRHLIANLLENGFAVAVFDLPGHGLSGGAEAEIESFEHYVRNVLDFLGIVENRLEGPYYGLGFSTGAAILVEMLLTGRAGGLDRIVLAAPLIHWNLYEQSKSTYKIYITFTDKIARFHRRNSSDREYLIFNKTQDYLHANYISLKWVKALFDWKEHIEKYPPCETPVYVLQGDKDGTVDWKYNLNLIRYKFPNAEIEIIKGANHELFNEASCYKQIIMKNVNSYFSAIKSPVH